MGLIADRAFSDRGSLGLSFSSPLQTTDGSATLTIPVSQDRNTGDIAFDSSSLSFDGAVREKVFEAYYNYDIDGKSSVFTHFSYTQNPLSNLDERKERTVFVGWRRRF